MRTATELLAQYAEYHRDRRNIVSHLVGVPMIVFGIGVLLARPALAAGGIAVTPAWIAFAFAAAWYLTRGNAVLGVLGGLYLVFAIVLFAYDLMETWGAASLTDRAVQLGLIISALASVLFILIALAFHFK